MTTGQVCETKGRSVPSRLQYEETPLKLLLCPVNISVFGAKNNESKNRNL